MLLKYCKIFDSSQDCISKKRSLIKSEIKQWICFWKNSFSFWIHFVWKHSWYNSCHHRKWSLWSKLKSWSKLIAFHIMAEGLGKYIDLDLYFLFLRSGIILWIELLWPENLVNTYAWHTETLESYFNLIWSHQQCIPWSPPLQIEPVTTDCRAKTLQLSHLSISHTSDAKLTSHGNCTTN